MATHRLRLATSKVLAMTAAELAALDGATIQLKAYAGVDPTDGKQEYLYDTVAANVGKREIDRVCKALDERANKALKARRQRRLDPAAPRLERRQQKDRTVRDAVEAWWKHHGSKLDGAPKVRGLVDGIILPHLGDIKVALVAGTPPDDDDERDPDLVYLAEKWEEIRLTGRKATGKALPKKPLEPATIHRCHGIVGAALRRAGHPIIDPGLPAMGAALNTTPIVEEMAAFLPYLAAGERTSPGYTVQRRVRGTTKTISYQVAARTVPVNAMDLMTEAFALLVGSGPRPVEAAAITRTQLDLAAGKLSLDGNGVIESRDETGKEIWIVATGETVKRRSRTLTLDTRTLAALDRWLKFQREASLAMGARLGPRALVFSLDPKAREPISPKVFSAAFGRAVDRARDADVELPADFHLYDMRHFGITQMLRNGHGRNVAAVAARFGTSTRMIHARYEHAIPSDDAALADIMTNVWGETPGGNAAVIDLGR